MPRLFHRSTTRPRRVEIAGNYAEFAEPGTARGGVLLLHRGAWSGAGPHSVRALRDVAARFHAWGWATLVASYRNGSAGIDDAVAAARWAMTRWEAPPACVYGESSGGHWALVMASLGHEAPLTVAAAAPTDLLSWAGMLDDEAASAYVRGVVRTTFGNDEESLARLSPARRQWDPAAAARLVLLYADDDPLVPAAQGQLLLEAAPSAELIRLPSGDQPWIHLVDGRGVDGRSVNAAFDRVRERLEVVT